MQATYDGLGRCVRRTVAGITTLFTYDGWKPIMEFDQVGNWKAWNAYGAGADEILVRWDAARGGPFFYKQDNRGSVTFLLDGNASVVEKIKYDAYGRPAVTSWDYATQTWKAASDRSSFGNRFMFTGREWLAEVNLYDYRHRFYSPDMGRFPQKDPIGFAAGDANLFRYCGDDPTNWTDPDGLKGRRGRGVGEEPGGVYTPTEMSPEQQWAWEFIWHNILFPPPPPVPEPPPIIYGPFQPPPVLPSYDYNDDRYDETATRLIPTTLGILAAVVGRVARLPEALNPQAPSVRVATALQLPKAIRRSDSMSW